MFTFVPEYIFETFDAVTPKFLESIGIKGVILDIDNTLEPYENLMPGHQVVDWLRSLWNAGIKTAIVSNNNRERVEKFNSELQMPAYYKAAKPFKRNLLRAMTQMGTDAGSTLLIGDQVFTDVWAAHNAKIPAILVPPIKDKRDAFTRFKRLLERPVIKKYRNKQEMEKKN